ncbi:MAG: hypothetical protein Kow00128_12250 [Deltaproteobacteria bacterium]
MNTRTIRCSILILLAVFLLAGSASAETLSWDAVTKYTDGTNIAPATVTYRAYWTTDATLATGLTPIGSSTTSTSVSFDVTASGMPRGSIIYFTCKATVSGVDSALASPLSWNVPVKAPSSPANLRLN